MPLHQALTRFRDALRVVLPRHEQGGGFAAQGYARSTGKVGVCIATSGPGATNLVTSIADAKLDSIPLIAITGQVGTSVIGCDAFQETPIVEVCRSVTKHHYLVTDPNDLARVVREAFHVATTGRPGPVLIDLPKNVQMAQVIPDYDEPMDLPGYSSDIPMASKEEITAIARMISESRRPVIYAGGGVIASNASRELFELAEKTGIPVHHDAHGNRRISGHAPPGPAHARHAWQRLCQPGRQRSRPAIGLWRALRRSRDRQGLRVRQARQDCPYRYRSVGDQ